MSATIEGFDEVTVVIPTRNEAGCIDDVLDQLLALGPAAVVVVDDSDDDTPQRVVARRDLPVVLLHRSPLHRSGGLGGAVCDAMALVRSPWMLVADGDGQHPLARAGDLLARREGADVVVASRYREGGGTAGLGRGRLVLSRLGVRLATAVHPGRLGGLTDPLSGFFLVRMSEVERERLRPDGFKILLDILLSAPRRMRVVEVGMPIGTRLSGFSKAGLNEVHRLVRMVLHHRLRTLLGQARR